MPEVKKRVKKVWKISPLFILLKASLNDWESVILYFRMPTSFRKRRHHHFDDDSDTDVKVIPFKKHCVNYSLEAEEEVKTIKIVHQSSSVSEMVMCEICCASLTSKYLDRHMKSMERTHNYVCKRKLAGKVRSRRSKGSLDRWNFKNLKLMKVKASRKAKRYF